MSDTQTSTIEPTFVAPGEPVATEQPAAPAAPHVEPAEPVAPVVPATEPTVEPTVEPDAADEAKPARAAKTELESEVKKVTDSFVTGELTLGDGEHLTPHRIAKQIKEARGADKSPSTGAVSSVLQRWESYGFATVSEKPKAFLDYTEAGREKGLSAMKAAAREAKRASAPVAADSASAPGVSPAEPADTV